MVAVLTEGRQSLIGFPVDRLTFPPSRILPLSPASQDEIDVE